MACCRWRDLSAALPLPADACHLERAAPSTTIDTSTFSSFTAASSPDSFYCGNNSSTARPNLRRINGVIRSYPTSMVTSTRLPDTAHKLNAISKKLAEHSNHISKQLDDLPEALKAVSGDFGSHHGGVKDVAKEVEQQTEMLMAKINNFNRRLSPALDKAMRFNDMLKRQSDWEHNALPADMFENSGAIVTNLKLAHKYGTNVLKHDVDELKKISHFLKLKYASVPGPEFLFSATSVMEAFASSSSFYPSHSRGLVASKGSCPKSRRSLSERSLVAFGGRLPSQSRCSTEAEVHKKTLNCPPSADALVADGLGDLAGQKDTVTCAEPSTSEDVLALAVPSRTFPSAHPAIISAVAATEMRIAHQQTPAKWQHFL
eukprot:TRINITY_DN70969_c0_g1_i1.p1 TRINITY_DN70969_c0_g1~~TRINITY_DN70969_c0_g1_i1.p1  ORF type:complete len:374 (+),score=55.46 TRINITY_DN70969_c0_g1_i1:66-1187(+)